MFTPPYSLISISLATQIPLKKCKETISIQSLLRYYCFYCQSVVVVVIITISPNNIKFQQSLCIATEIVIYLAKQHYIYKFYISCNSSNGLKARTLKCLLRQGVPIADFIVANVH